MAPDDVRRVFQKVWWFLWEDTSIWSWLANIVIAFVLIKFVVYPVLGVLLGTSYPIVAVVSSSMEHPAGFEAWWNEEQCCNSACASRIAQGRQYAGHGITPEDFVRFPFRNGFYKGDVMILRSPEELSIGDILVFRADGRGDPIIHRIVQVRQLSDGTQVYTTKGDNNCGSAGFERDITSERMIGKAVARVPFLGWIKIVFVEVLEAFGVGG
jgi:hypothetical protein